MIEEKSVYGLYREIEDFSFRVASIELYCGIFATRDNSRQLQWRIGIERKDVDRRWTPCWQSEPHHDHKALRLKQRAIYDTLETWIVESGFFERMMEDAL